MDNVSLEGSWRTCNPNGIICRRSGRFVLEAGKGVNAAIEQFCRRAGSTLLKRNMTACVYVLTTVRKNKRS